MTTPNEVKPCMCGNTYLAIRTDIYKDKREFIYCDCCGAMATRTLWQTAIAQPEQPTPNEVTDQEVSRFALTMGVTDCQNLIRQALATFLAHRTSATSDAAIALPVEPSAVVQEPVFHLRQYGYVTEAEMAQYMATGAISEVKPVAKAEPTAQPMKAVQITIEALRRAAKEIRDGHFDGWGNTCDDAASLLEQLSATPPPVAGDAGWQPIETAPKDGTEIILCAAATHDQGICYWRDDKVMTGWTWGMGKHFRNPLYWMPRLSPPIAAIAAGGSKV